MQSSKLDYQRLKTSSLAELRNAIRDSHFQGQTAGLAPGYLQANIIILPENHALDFMRFCQRNPKPCPLVGVSDTGNPIMHTLGRNIDIRTDVPAYNVYRHGELSESLVDISALWSQSFVAFALGCSFTFENALSEAGIPIWHVQQNKTVPMYRSNILNTVAGSFGSEMVVTMRAIDEDRVEEVIAISRRFPLAHGGPVHIGKPELIGLRDLSAPDWGDSPPPLEGKVPVFWACGVTPQNALMAADMPLFISHKPGHMLITDIDDQSEVPVYSA